VQIAQRRIISKKNMDLTATSAGIGSLLEKIKTRSLLTRTIACARPSVVSFQDGFLA